jgi:hypothetical protein
MLMSCPFCGTGTDLPHDTQEACIAALHSEISHIRRIVEGLQGPTFANISASQSPDEISGDSPNPPDPPDEHR